MGKKAKRFVFESFLFFLSFIVMKFVLTLLTITLIIVESFIAILVTVREDEVNMIVVDQFIDVHQFSPQFRILARITKVEWSSQDVEEFFGLTGEAKRAKTMSVEIFWSIHIVGQVGPDCRSQRSGLKFDLSLASDSLP